MAQEEQQVRPEKPNANVNYQNALGSMGNQILQSIWVYIEKPENKNRLMNILDPIIQHIIKTIFPYIAFSAVLFVLLLIVAVMTLVVSLKATGTSIFPAATVAAAAVSTVATGIVESVAVPAASIA